MEEKTIVTGKLNEKMINVISGIFAALGVIALICISVSVDEMVFVCLGLGILFLALAVFALVAKKCCIVVTDKRVYCEMLFGMRVDLPLDSVSAVGKSMFKGIAVRSASGKIALIAVENRDEVHKAIVQLLIERQQTGNV